MNINTIRIPLMLLGLAVGAYLIISPRINHNKHCKEIFTEPFDEIVVKKYRVPSNKNLPELAFASGERLVLMHGFEALYEIAEVGDTVTKDTGSFQFAVHKVDTVLPAMIYCE
jgi:hypothetical protein